MAKNQTTFEHLKNQFQKRETEKIYNAFVYGVMDEEDGVIDRSIGRSSKDFRMWSAQRGARGELRDALTVYKVLERGRPAEAYEGGFSYLEVRPKTGRTHQIRVHLKAINHPVVNDPLYAPKREAALGFTRLALHARSLDFISVTGHMIHIEAPLPEDFVRGLKELKATE
jgi:23S rRNA pseudouridine1911/1915/1917 synthase